MTLPETLRMMRETDAKYDFVYGVNGTVCTLDYLEENAISLGLKDQDGYDYDEEEGCVYLDGKELISNFGNIHDFICDHVSEEFANQDEDDILAFSESIEGFTPSDEDIEIVLQMLG